MGSSDEDLIVGYQSWKRAARVGREGIDEVERYGRSSRSSRGGEVAWDCHILTWHLIRGRQGVDALLFGGSHGTRNRVFGTPPSGYSSRST